MKKNIPLQRGRPWGQELWRDLDPCFENRELGLGHLRRSGAVPGLLGSGVRSRALCDLSREGSRQEGPKHRLC